MRTNDSFSGPQHQKSGKNVGVLQDLRPMRAYRTASAREATLKKLEILVIGVAVITLFVASLWWAADRNEAFSQDQMWLVD